ncbi:hypothetical protein CVT25_001993 [Psilocybe cyanescens]|uniref:Uncharacterized protein n=1 Tax=Psilocybe cyanescens TaxID=93625 RepID=A0A409VUM1_PSICY|nr:hypothetical protein CVT25_001993 [Psilocybe cyanescens]
MSVSSSARFYDDAASYVAPNRGDDPSPIHSVTSVATSSTAVVLHLPYPDGETAVVIRESECMFVGGRMVPVIVAVMDVDIISSRALVSSEPWNRLHGFEFV